MANANDNDGSADMDAGATGLGIAGETGAGQGGLSMGADYGSAMAEAIGSGMQAAQSQGPDKESDAYSPPVVGNKANIAPSGYFSLDAYSDSPKTTGWAPGQALLDQYGNPVTLEAHQNAMPVSEAEKYRQQAYAAKAAQPGINLPFVGKVTADTVAKAAFSAISPAGTIGGMVTAGLDAIGLPNIGPFMSAEDRNWDDARWSDAYDTDMGETWANYHSPDGAPSSPAGGEQITVSVPPAPPAPPGAPDQRVTQFKALYPAEWTETLTDEEIIAMVENPDQLRYWLSWRQS